MWQRHLIALSCLALFGCASTARVFTGEAYRVDTPWYDSRTDKLSPGDTSDSLIDLASYCFREDVDSRGEGGTAGACDASAYDRAQGSAIDRDRLQDLLLDASNRECDQHKASSVGTNTGFNLGLSMITSLLSGAATGFSATSTKTALSAGATFFSSTRAQLNEQVYRQLFVGTVLVAIDDDRQAQLLDIMARRRYPVPKEEWDSRASGIALSLGREDEVAAAVPATVPAEAAAATDGPDEEPDSSLSEVPELMDDAQLDGIAAGDDSRRFYGIDEAIRDATTYHERCSFYNGLVRLSTKVEEFSPCRLLEERRERLLAEVAAMRASGVHETFFEAKHEAYSGEIDSLNTKLAGCSPGGGS